MEVSLTAMDETEKMVALKKAYADMILNTSKEAAARVMAAERKAQKSEQDIISMKEEAVRMLLRMKQMIDSKNREAEDGSLNEKRRINELEAQLDEAEGLIIDLRAQLSEVQDQLDGMKRKYMHSLRRPEKVVMPCQSSIYENEQSYFAPFKSFSELESKTLTSEVLASTSEHSILDHECFTSERETETPNTELDYHHMHKPSVASFRSKEPELFRNRCTQRICAFETGLVDVKLHSADEVNFLLENKSTIRRNEQNEAISSMPVPGTDRSCELEISIKQAAFLKDNLAYDKSVKLHKMHRRRTHYSRPKVTSCKYRSGKVVKRRRTSFALSHCKSHSRSSSDVHRPGCVSTNTRNSYKVDYACGLEEKEHLAKHQPVSVIRRSVRKRKTKNWDGFATSCHMNDSHSSRYDETHKCDQKVHNDLFEVEDGGKIEEGICIGAASAKFTTCMHSVQGSTFLGDFAEKDSGKIDKSTLEKQDGLASDNELENISWVLSDSKDIKTSEMINKAPSQPDSKMPLKYKFSRKRKAALTNPTDINSSQQSSTKKSYGEETDKVLEADSSNRVHESSRDVSRLVQVAHQLISLSSMR